MKRRYWISIATGAAVLLTTAAELWKYTTLPIEDVIFISLIGYIAGTAAALVATEPKRSRRQHRAHCLGAGMPALWTLERKDWEHGYDGYR